MLDYLNQMDTQESVVKAMDGAFAQWDAMWA